MQKDVGVPFSKARKLQESLIKGRTQYLIWRVPREREDGIGMVPHGLGRKFRERVGPLGKLLHQYLPPGLKESGLLLDSQTPLQHQHGCSFLDSAISSRGGGIPTHIHGRYQLIRKDISNTSSRGRGTKKALNSITKESWASCVMHAEQLQDEDF
ncbi:hypothetical protein J437_LFUL018371 [Ladona fulva]|uniref:Uncharacterized protein n=1 Tax=Ladona fulva TaxID=123851 RepID=A0A8K0KVW3_LADFU|nr:hypothetical protein J437_LFUL018371 [Ladona fulva]